MFLDQAGCGLWLVNLGVNSCYSKVNCNETQREHTQHMIRFRWLSFCYSRSITLGRSKSASRGVWVGRHTPRWGCVTCTSFNASLKFEDISRNCQKLLPRGLEHFHGNKIVESPANLLPVLHLSTVKSISTRRGSASQRAFR